MISLTLTRARAHALALPALLWATAAAAEVENATLPAPVLKNVPVNDFLPSGDGHELRERLTAWSRPSEMRPRLIESVEARGQAAASTKRLIISSGYGWRTDPIRGGHRRHQGIDLPGRFGSGVHATGAGVVSFAGWASGYGNLVQIDHPAGLRTRYGHLAQILVRPGSKVLQGDIVGRMGSTGRSTATHLHYEVRVRGTPVNPLTVMGTSQGGDVPHYSVAWTKPRTVTPRWIGWTDDDSHLPEAWIR